jgi:hypothetical protein
MASVAELKEKHASATASVNSLRERLRQRRETLLDTDGEASLPTPRREPSRGVRGISGHLLTSMCALDCAVQWRGTPSRRGGCRWASTLRIWSAAARCRAIAERLLTLVFHLHFGTTFATFPLVSFCSCAIESVRWLGPFFYFHLRLWNLEIGVASASNFYLRCCSSWVISNSVILTGQ